MLERGLIVAIVATAIILAIEPLDPASWFAIDFTPCRDAPGATIKCRAD